MAQGARTGGASHQVPRLPMPPRRVNVAVGRRGLLPFVGPAPGRDSCCHAVDPRSVPVLRLTNATKRFGDRALLRGVHLQVAAGARVGLVGANGAGKSTLMRAIL